MLRYRSMVILTVAPTDPTLPIPTNPILLKRQCMYDMDKIKFELGNFDEICPCNVSNK